MAGATERITVEVVYCPVPGVVDESTVSVDAGTTLAGVLRASGLAARHQDLEAQMSNGELQTGVWGKLQTPDHVLRDGDRVEIYRPLKVDPMEARRRRQKAQAAPKMR